MVHFFRDGDTLVVRRIDRLAQSMKDYRTLPMSGGAGDGSESERAAN
ncbi:hypothetical protein [Sphingomonas sp. Leaf67]